jgi:Uma2 family endonuclease
MSDITPLVTAEELQRLPDDGYRYELVGGRLIRMSPVNFDHGRVVMRIGFLLSRHLEQLPVGVIGTEIGFKLASNPDTVRGPDIAFVRNGRVVDRARCERGPMGTWPVEYLWSS